MEMTVVKIVLLCLWIIASLPAAAYLTLTAGGSTGFRIWRLWVLEVNMTHPPQSWTVRRSYSTSGRVSATYIYLPFTEVSLHSRAAEDGIEERFAAVKGGAARLELMDLHGVGMLFLWNALSVAGMGAITLPASGLTGISLILLGLLGMGAILRGMRIAGGRK